MAQLRDTETAREQRTARYRNWSPDADTPTVLTDDASDDDGPDPADAYTDVVQKDRAVCDTCFAYRYDVTAVEWWRGTFGWSDYVTWDARRDHAVPVPADDTPAQGMRLACGTCGTRGGMKHRPVPGAKVPDYVAHLSDTLALKGVAHAPSVLHYTVRHLNTSEHQCKQDTHVFGPAVAAAIRAVQYDPAPYTRGRDHSQRRSGGRTHEV